MVVVIQDVRNNLAGMSSERLSPEEIQQQIGIATRYCQYYKGSSTNQDILDDAILWYATWQCYLVYVAEFERSSGRIPNPVLIHLVRYENKANEYLIMIGSGRSAPDGLLSTTSIRGNRIEEHR